MKKIWTPSKQLQQALDALGTYSIQKSPVIISFSRPVIFQSPPDNNNHRHGH